MTQSGDESLMLACPHDGAEKRRCPCAKRMCQCCSECADVCSTAGSITITRDGYHQQEQIEKRSITGALLQFIPHDDQPKVNLDIVMSMDTSQLQEAIDKIIALGTEPC